MNRILCIPEALASIVDNTNTALLLNHLIYLTSHRCDIDQMMAEEAEGGELEAGWIPRRYDQLLDEAFVFNNKQNLSKHIGILADRGFIHRVTHQYHGFTKVVELRIDLTAIEEAIQEHGYSLDNVISAVNTHGRRHQRTLTAQSTNVDGAINTHGRRHQHTFIGSDEPEAENEQCDGDDDDASRARGNMTSIGNGNTYGNNESTSSSYRSAVADAPADPPDQAGGDEADQDDSSQESSDPPENNGLTERDREVGIKPNDSQAERRVKHRAAEVIDHLNQRCYRRFDPSKGKGQVGKVRERLREGYTVDQLMKVLEYKARQWLDRHPENNIDLRPYLRPKTLFAPENFPEYLDEAERHEGNSDSNNVQLEDEFKKLVRMAMLKPDEDTEDVDLTPIERRRRKYVKYWGPTIKEKLRKQGYTEKDMAQLTKQAREQGPIEEVPQ